MNVLVVGGAGYIGAHMVKRLLDRGHRVTTLDDFSTGHREAVLGGELVAADLGDASAVRAALAAARPDAVMHFASFIQVGESVQEPAKYYLNNVAKTLVLLDEVRKAGVRRFVFSSTAAIFGEPEYVPIDERHPAKPINPYGRTKLMVEEALADFDRAYGLRSVCLRYFNAAGADPGGAIGERHDPETHLIPLVLQAASGRRPSIAVFGTDYDTPDGTCIRDYIHVVDLCDAHLLAIEWMDRHDRSGAFNLGNGQGFSVHEVIATAEKVCGRPITVVRSPRRAGDPARLVADATLARRELGWTPGFTALETIVDHAWCWERNVAGL
jgi:UDP-glucose 4-epimerase